VNFMAPPIQVAVKPRQNLLGSESAPSYQSISVVLYMNMSLIKTTRTKLVESFFHDKLTSIRGLVKETE
jgi:hypothetical protein